MPSRLKHLIYDLTWWREVALGLVCPKKMGRKTRDIICNLNSATIAKRSMLKKWPTPARIKTTPFQLADI